MAADPRGRWFRVYSRQALQHPKFKGLSHAELGAWLDIRAAVDLMDGSPLADRAEALLRLRRRSKSPAKLLDRLIEVRLLDVMGDGGIAIHDLDEHDPRTASDDPERVRERVARHRAKERNAVTSKERNAVTSVGNAVTPKPVTEPRAREESREEESREEAEQTAREELPDENDPLTVICQLLMTAAPIEDGDYRAKVDSQARRYSADWVIAAYRQAYQDSLTEGSRPQRWTLSRLAEVHLAEWTRREELRGIEAQHEREQGELQSLTQQAAAAATPEEQERQSLIRRAVGVWLKGGRKGQVPTETDKLRAWLDQNEQASA